MCIRDRYWNPLFRSRPFVMLYNLKKTEQSRKYHPEGNVWIHTLMVVDEAARMRGKSKNPAVLMWAALLHDVGKAVMTKRQKGRISSRDHDVAGARMAEEFLGYFVRDREFIGAVCRLVRYHMYILFVNRQIPGIDMEEMKRCVDPQEMALLGLSDRLGRGNSRRELEEKNIQEFLRIFEKN